jgi:hypothetical protein
MPKDRRGLEVRDLRVFNKALLEKYCGGLESRKMPFGIKS